MLLRIWTTAVLPERERDYLAFVRSRSHAMFLAQDGCLGVFFLRRSNGRHAACSLWRDLQSIQALGESPLYVTTVRALSTTGVLAGEASVEIFEVTTGSVTKELSDSLEAL